MVTVISSQASKYTQRNTEIISKARASVTEENIRNWFAELRDYLIEEHNEELLENPHRIFNADETGVTTCPKTGKVLGPKNYKAFYEIASGPEKECITVLCTFSAAGVSVPPMIVYPYKRIPRDLSNSVPDDWAIGRSDSGWMVSSTFYEFIANVFHPWIIENHIKLPVLLFLDGHKSHINMELSKFCSEKGILLYCLLPSATHILQPCDVPSLNPLKINGRRQYRAINKKQVNQSQKLTLRYCSKRVSTKLSALKLLKRDLEYADCFPTAR
nr:unnamed protein product [Callosobruchus analis]